MEQPLPAYGCCNLGSINIANDYFFSGDNFDYDKLGEVTRRVTIFLDRVGTVNKFPTEKTRMWYEDNRPIGIGIMGFADALLRLGILYGSEESITFLEKVMKKIMDDSYTMSETLGKVLGVPKNCQYPEINRRNITTVSIAPTGSISFIAGVSSGIEPIFSPNFTRTDERGEIYTVEHQLKNEPYFASTIDSPNNITWKQHIDVQAAAQKHCDSGISKTINFENDATVDDVYDAMVYAWQQDCKGITVYRDGSREIQVLSSNKEETPEIVREQFNCEDGDCKLVYKEGCATCEKCGLSMCSI